MSFVASTLRYRHAVWALAIGVSIFGVRAWQSLPMQLFPDTNPPLVRIMTAFPGASAEDVAEALSRPLEEVFASLEAVVSVQAQAQDNLSAITIEFQYDRSAELAALDVQNAIARIRGSLPAGIAEPRVSVVTADDRPILSLGLVGEDPGAIRRWAEDELAPGLQRLRGVAAVDVFGGSRPAVLVEPDALLAAGYGLDPVMIAGAIRGQSVALPAGQVRTVRQDTMYRIELRARSVAELEALPVPLPGGGHVRLGAVATVREGALVDESRFAVNGEPAIAVQIFKTSDANTVDVVARALDEAGAMVAARPGTDLRVGEETATFTSVSVRNLLDNVWQALLLAAFVIFMFLGRVTPSLIAVMSMLLSYALTFALMSWTDTELNMVTLSAIILAVGMVVDASVVVIENIARHRAERGLSPARAAESGADEVRTAIVAGAATTMAVLIPLLLLPGFVGRLFGPLARTLIFAFGSSILVALVFVPILTTVLPDLPGVDRATSRLIGVFERLMDRVRQAYGWVLERALERRAATLLLALLLFGLGLGGIRMAGMEVLPRMDGGSFFVSFETASGSSLDFTESALRDVERVLLAEPEVRLVQSQVGYEPGMRSMGAGGLLGPTQGFVTVVLSDRTDRSEDLWSIQNRVRQRLAGIPELQHVTVRELGNTAKSTTAAPIVIRLSASDPLLLDRLGDELLAALAGIPDLVGPSRNWRRDQLRTELVVDRLRAMEWGLQAVDVAALARQQLNGLPAGEFWPPVGTPLPVRVEPLQVNAAEAPLRIPVFVGERTTPLWLDEVLHEAPTLGQGLVSRQDLLPTLEITAFGGGRPLSFVTTDVAELLAGLTLPAGVEMELVGDNRDLQESRGAILGALLVAILTVYLLLVAQFRSFMHPVTVLAAVPLSLIGVSAALLIAGKPVSMPVMVGLVLLVGIVVNNSIILLDFIRQSRDAGRTRRDALILAVSTRFRPIMMTSVSTVGGMIPLAGEWALGAERFSPLAIAVIGGLTAATFLTLVVVPVLYDVLDGLASGWERIRA